MMNIFSSHRSSLAGLMGFLLCMPILLSYAQPTSQSHEGIYLIFDASGSMWGKLADGSYKIHTAVQVLSDFVQGDFEGKELALRAYGHRREKDCSDSELLVPFGPPEQVIQQFQTAVKNINPKGRTPISRSLRLALEDFGDRKGDIILISDGLETCDEDPCALVKAWREKNIQIKVHVVGLGLVEKEKAAMRCLAEAGGTTYQDAASSEELIEGLNNAREESVHAALVIEGWDEKGKRQFLTGTLSQAGKVKYQVTSNGRNIVESGTYLLSSGVSTQTGKAYRPVSQEVEVAPSGETRIRLQVKEPPAIWARFIEGDKPVGGSLIRAYQHGREVFSFRPKDTVYVQEGTYEFRSEPNAENILSVQETITPNDRKEILFKLVHTVHVNLKFIASDSDIWYRRNAELWQDGQQKYTVHVYNGGTVLPGVYEVILPHKVRHFTYPQLTITSEPEQSYEMTVPSGLVTFIYQAPDGSRDKDDRCFVRKAEGGSTVHHNSGQQYALPVGTYQVEAWKRKREGNYDPVVFEVKKGETLEVVLRAK